MLILSAALVLTGCGGNNSNTAASGSEPGTSSDPVTITWWSWLTSSEALVKEFEAQHPNIKVDYVNTPGQVAYPKYTTALRAGTGAPDVAQIEYQMLPQFAQEGHLVDLTKYSDKYMSDFSDFSRRLVTYQDKIFGFPNDLDPMGLIYKPDLFEKYQIEVPTTWAQFADAAAKLHTANPDMYLTYFTPNNGARLMGILWQGGVTPFEQTPDGEWKINFTSPEAKKVMNYWGDLIKKGYVKAANDYTPEWGNDLAKGTYAADVGAIWSPTYEISPYISKDQYNWKAAPMPQWDSANPIESMWGGLSFVVTDQSKHPDEAALFAAWLGTNEKALELNGSIGGLYEASKKFKDVPAFKSTQPVLGGQQANLMFSEVIPTLEKSNFEWSPWTQYVYGQMQTEFSKAVSGQETWDKALETIQANVTKFAEMQGFKIVK
jgi:multiple sugar transport system substrate-binding protein